MKDTRRHPAPARHREDDDRPRSQGDSGRVRSGAERHEDRREARRREAVRDQGRRRCARRLVHGKFKRQGRFAGQRPDWKKAWVRPEGRRKGSGVHRRYVGQGSHHADSQVQADVGRPAVSERSDVRRHHDQPAVQAARRDARALGRAQQRGTSDVVVAWRRAQAQLPHHRLQARQVQHPGQGLDGRVRPEPVGAHRARDLRRRREALHPASARPEGRRPGDLG